MRDAELDTEVDTADEKDCAKASHFFGQILTKEMKQATERVRLQTAIQRHELPDAKTPQKFRNAISLLGSQFPTAKCLDQLLDSVVRERGQSRGKFLDKLLDESALRDALQSQAALAMMVSNSVDNLLAQLALAEKRENFQEAFILLKAKEELLSTYQQKWLPMANKLGHERVMDLWAVTKSRLSSFSSQEWDQLLSMASSGEFQQALSHPLVMRDLERGQVMLAGKIKPQACEPQSIKSQPLSKRKAKPKCPFCSKRHRGACSKYKPNNEVSPRRQTFF